MSQETAYSKDHLLRADFFKSGPRYSAYRSKGSGDWLIIYTVKGSGCFSFAKERIYSREGSVMLYPPGVAQDYRTRPGLGYWHLLWAHFRPRVHWMIWLDWPEILGGLRRVELSERGVNREVERAFREAVKFERQQFSWSLDLGMNALEKALLWIHSTRDRPMMDARVLKAIDYLAEHLREPLLLDDVARACGLSPSRLSHLFTEQVGISVQKYQEQARLQRATQLLRNTNFTIGEVADECGYASPFYFSSRFRKTVGQSPSDFRRHSREK